MQQAAGGGAEEKQQQQKVCYLSRGTAFSKSYCRLALPHPLAHVVMKEKFLMG